MFGTDSSLMPIGTTFYTKYSLKKIYWGAGRGTGRPKPV